MNEIIDQAPERCRYCGKFCSGWPLWKFTEHVDRCPQRPKPPKQPKRRTVYHRCRYCGEFIRLSFVHHCKRKRATACQL